MQVILDGKQIRSVTAQGIVYVDDDGEDKFIDFSECYENYLKTHLAPEFWARIKELNKLTDADWDKYVERVKGWREIARRNVLTWSGGPFIEFHTKPPIRFKFAIQEKYHAVIQAIYETDWVTFDLS